MKTRRNCGNVNGMKRISVGILAHVDAGKTTCIESMLYNAGNIRKMGRVDHQDAFLDFDDQERQRGITIYSKETYFEYKDTQIFCVDTPGHVDFSSEMERVLQVLDLAVILINSQDGIQSHTETIWRCLKHYQVPVILFFNKMDITYKSKEELMEQVQKQCSSNCIDFSMEDRNERLALVNEELLNTYLETNEIDKDLIKEAIYKRECFPCFFGSALKNEGIVELMDALVQYSVEKEYGDEFGAKIYKISQDEKGNRLTHVKVTSGTLYAKQKINEEKVDQIRLYNGKKFMMIDQAPAGTICCLKGLSSFQAGQGLGIENDGEQPLLNAYMNYEMLLPGDVDALEMMRYLRVIAQEDPGLEIQYDPNTKSISLSLMGAIQIEVLQNLIEQRSHVKVGFSQGSIRYKETIQEEVIGRGHFEPLRHYAEVHLKLEPLPPNSGLRFDSKVHTDQLSLNWQRLILKYLNEHVHKGILTGSPITDMAITLVQGKVHLKHTEPNDLRQAASRALRQGLKKSTCVLLEPYYRFTLKVPKESVSRALYDFDQKKAEFQIVNEENEMTEIMGTGPVKALMNYQQDVLIYTKGKGNFTFELDGYYPCADQEAIVEAIGYDSEADLEAPTGSVFCKNGAGYHVPWNEADDLMHIHTKNLNDQSYQSVKYKINEEELKRVVAQTGGKNKNEKKIVKKTKKEYDLKKVEVRSKKEDCLIIDGYNMIYAWQDLSQLAKVSISSARDRLIDMISNYQGYKGCKVILVFDAYRVKNHGDSQEYRGNTSIVYTRSSQTADSYIESKVHELKDQYTLYVATSDGLIQNAIFAQGAYRISSRELELQVKNVNKNAMNDLKSL